MEWDIGICPIEKNVFNKSKSELKFLEFGLPNVFAPGRNVGVGMNNAGFFHDGELATLNHLKKNGLAFGLPATLLINRDGCVLGTLNGPAEWAGDDAKTLIKVALGSPDG